MTNDRAPNMQRILALCVACTLLGGCQSVAPPACVDDCGGAEVEPNDSFPSARVIALAVDGSTTLTGEISVVDDIDIFDLGAVSAGDTVSVSMQRVDGTLRSALALYDGEGELINEDTLTSISSPTADPAIVHQVREASDRVFIAVSHNTVRPSLGAYELSVEITRGGAVVPPSMQTILLSFTGGVIDDPVFGRYDVGPFDAGEIEPRYDDDTDLIKSVIKQVFAQNYARFTVDIWDTDDPRAAAQLAGRSFSRVIFGGFNSFAFGAAEEVDLYNTNTVDAAIIFTQSFQPGLFEQPPTAEGLGVAIGNVAAHEMGHLLGLHHVIDAIALMDEASPAFTLLDDQEFKSAPLSPSIFPLGSQDSADLLAVILGLRPGVVAKSAPPASPPAEEAWARLLRNSQADAMSAKPAPMGKCVNCLWREALCGRGPLKDFVTQPQTPIPTHR